MNQNYDVFISYRRSDGTTLARAVRDCKRQINREGEKENRAEWSQENHPAR